MICRDVAKKTSACSFQLCTSKLDKYLCSVEIKLVITSLPDAVICQWMALSDISGFE